MAVSAVKRRPARGGVGGLLLGLGVGVLLLVYGQAPFGRWTVVILVGAGLVVGVLAGLAGPVPRSGPGVTTPQGPPSRQAVRAAERAEREQPPAAEDQ